MTESTALTTTTATPGALAFLHDGAAFEHLWRVAKAFSMSSMVPAAYQGKPENCMIALMYSEQLGEPAMLVFQEMAPINGRPSTSARFAISRANKSGLLQGPITWKIKGTGDALEVTASATMLQTREVITAMVSMKEAIADNWIRNSKYKSMPEQMLRWRAATRLIGLYMPEVLFGLGVKEEAEVQTVSVGKVAQQLEQVDMLTYMNRQIAAQPVAAQVVEAEPVAVELTPAEPTEVVEDPF